MVLCGPPISPLGTFPGTFTHNSTPSLARVSRGGEKLGCGLAVLNAEEEPEAHRLLPFQLWAGEAGAAHFAGLLRGGGGLTLLPIRRSNSGDAGAIHSTDALMKNK